MKIKNIWKAVIAISVSELAGVIGSFFTSPAIPGWYAGLNKPNFAPPNWIFAPVWTTLFALMGIAVFLVWRKGIHLKEVKVAIFAFGAQLTLNILWSAIFFGLRSPGAALAEILILLAAIIVSAILFSRVSKPAAWLLVPYIMWVSFASYLNFMIWRLN
jgi:tryptophan-rich sensory protein